MHQSSSFPGSSHDESTDQTCGHCDTADDGGSYQPFFGDLVIDQCS